MIKLISQDQEYVLDELSSLCERIIKLAGLLSSPKPSHIDDDEWFLLNAQLTAMSLYRDLLSRRISAFW